MKKKIIYTLRVKNAIRFSIKTHEIYQKQKRKGKDVAYITHPMTVGIILGMAGAEEDLIIAGILHDTIEDSVEEKKVDERMLQERFGEKVMRIVKSVSEDKDCHIWAERKKRAREKIRKFNHDSLLVKSADTISNVVELIDDYIVHGDETFNRFGGGKEKVIENYLKVMKIIIKKWRGNPLRDDLENLIVELEKLDLCPVLKQKTQSGRIKKLG